MTINYNVPFYSNTPDDTHCFQAGLKMMLKYFMPEKDFSWEELDKVTAKVEGLWTWPIAGILWLKKMGFDVVDIEIFDYQKFADEGEKCLFEFYGQEVGKEQVAHSDIAQERKLAKELSEAHMVQLRLPTIEDITDLLRDGYLIGCMLNSKALNGKVGYVGHSVVIKGVYENQLILHDPGLPPLENRKVDFTVFEKAWAYPDEKAKNILAAKIKSI
jgi:hypothetical protein